VVFFDLETTGFDRPIRPVQIGAVDSWGENCFNEYVWPRRHVHPKATLTNNFYTKRNNLYHHGEKVACLDLEDALAAFLEWLEELGGDVVLVAHKCLDYDAKVLLRNMEEFSISYSSIIRGFSDSLLASRQLYTEAPSHKLSAMLTEVGLPTREEHDALEDAVDCRRICRRMAGASSASSTLSWNPIGITRWMSNGSGLSHLDIPPFRWWKEGHGTLTTYCVFFHLCSCLSFGSQFIPNTSQQSSSSLSCQICVNSKFRLFFSSSHLKL